MGKSRPLIVLAFSNASNSEIYDAIVQEFSSLEVDLECIYFGAATTPIQNFAESLGVSTLGYKLDSLKNQIHAISKTAIFLGHRQPSIVFGFGQTATLISFLSSIFLPKTLRVYSRQHTSSNRIDFPIKGRVYDGLSNKLAHRIIVSSKNQHEYLINSENVNPKKIRICEFGFNISAYANPKAKDVENFRGKYNIDSSKFIIGIVSRIQDIKGLKYSISAISRFLKLHPNSLVVIANAADATRSQLKFVYEAIPKSNLLIIERESRMAPAYHCMDVLIHVPIDETVESYGLVYVEAFASGLPTIITKSGVANEIAQDSSNCIVVDYCNSDQIFSALVLLFSSQDLRKRLGRKAAETVEHLDLTSMQRKYRFFLENELKSIN
jgi:glycosyltransferase involved in cell wall biosynthesis